MVTALYRRYRPETFGELIGQSQVTDPLRTALRTDRVNHAYLFSGPRGCGKTTSARILARCLNCAEGPTDTPCGVCQSCIELSRDGSGSLDVVEIDAASHNGVDDARDLRERAVFAPARDRYKIFILDEAHMVTPQGFNALLKIVEEPPEHVKFIFATTEPEKVIGTIRSRTHHYPFRLVPPAQMLEYLESLCREEKVDVEPGVLPLVVRAGGGSVRDTLSLLDQLIAGSEGASIVYERAVALLGYTHGALLDEVVEAIGARDAGAAFGAVDRVIQTGQDPRRFVEDLLERLRDLIIVAASRDAAAAVLRGVQQDELDRMAVQASRFGPVELSRAADVVNSALTEMTGATSPRLHLELMVARILVPSGDASGALARVERLERRIGVEAGAEPVAVSTASVTAPPVPPVTPAARPATPSVPPAADRVVDGLAPAAAPEPASSAAPAASAAAAAFTPPAAVSAPGSAAGTAASAPEPAAVGEPVDPSTVTLQQVKDSWPQILEGVQKLKLSSWTVVYTATPLELRPDNVLVLSMPSQADVDAIRQASAPGEGVADHLKQAVFDVLGFRPLLIARAEARAEPVAGTGAARAEPVAPPQPEPGLTVTWETAPVNLAPPELAPPEEDAPAIEPATPDYGDAAGADSPPIATPEAGGPVASAARPAPEQPAAPAQTSVPAQPSAPAQPWAPRTAPVATIDGKQRYGESVVREILGASFIEEQPLPRSVQQEQ